MGRSLLFLLVFLLFFPVVFGLPGVVVSEDSWVLNQTVGTVDYYPLVVSNVGDVVVYNLSFSSVDGFVFPVIPSLGVNASFSSSFSFESSFVLEGLHESVLSFDYYSLVNVSPVSVVVGVSSGSFSVPDVDLVAGSTITFFNDDVIPLLLRCVSLNVSHELLVGQNFSFVVPEGDWLFFEDNFGVSHLFSVGSRERSVLVHNSDFDVPLLFDVVPLGQFTTLSVDFLVRGFDVDFSGITTGVLRVTNTGDFSTVNAKIFGDWVDPVPFVLDPGDSKLLLFNVSPVGIDKTSETNRTYEQLIKVGGGNALLVNDSVFVFVRFHDFDSFVDEEGNVIRVTYLSVDQTLAYCKARPSDVQCNELVRVVNRTVVENVYENVSLPSNVVRSLSDGLVKLTDSTERLTNSQRETRNDLSVVKSDLSNVSSRVVSYMSKVDSLEKSLDDQRRSSRNKAVLFWVVAFVVVVVGGLWYFLRKNNKSMNFFRGVKS